MNEVKLLSGLLAVLLVSAYMTWTKDDDKQSSSEVVLLDIAEAQLDKVEYFAATATVAFWYRDIDKKSVPWFEVENARGKRVFVGNEKVDDLRKDLAPFKALRSLGKNLDAELLKMSGLDKPKRKLVLHHGGKTKSFEAGGRTNGARDHYVRNEGGTEVYLVASRILQDLQFPEGKFMLRLVKPADKKEVEKIMVSANGQSKTGLQSNRLSPSDAYWAQESAPNEKDETLGNYLDKLIRLSAIEYLVEDKPFDDAEPVLSSVWYGEGDKELGTIELRRTGEGKKAQYYAVSSATLKPVKISRLIGEQLEKDRDTILAP